MVRSSALRSLEEDSAYSSRFQNSKAHNLPSPPQFPALPPPNHVAIGPGDVDVRLLDKLGADAAIREGLLPWRKAGAVTVVAAAEPERAEGKRRVLEDMFGPVSIALTDKGSVEAAVEDLRKGELAARAEHRTSPQFSCRHFEGRKLTRFLGAGLAIFTVVAIAAPGLVFAALVLWASFWLFVSTLLKVAATIAAGRATPRALPQPANLPTISILVPLFRERDIAGRLVKRLQSLSYPTKLLEICLIVEKHDTITRTALANTNLPKHMRQVVVPPGSLQTKPRAMNYALDFTHGDIIGVYDAEDAPAPDQLRVVAAEFEQAAPNVACLQGKLDFYNPRTNWLSRCFTVDYAVWFRAILPGIARLGFAVPLGGTTLFFRRSVLETVGAWDAHNVTEDADLGIRLARLGWRTKLIATTTQEEANCRIWPWIKQRSRWIKGYAVTWAVHMRHPRRLWSDLGTWRFLGFQAVFLGAISQFVLAPFLWSFWLILLGLPHPLIGTLPDVVILGLATLFFAAEISNIAVGAWACRGQNHRWLIPWVPSLHFYFPLAAIASWKGLAEIVKAPFYWDKTDHGMESTS